MNGGDRPLPNSNNDPNPPSPTQVQNDSATNQLASGHTPDVKIENGDLHLAVAESKQSDNPSLQSKKRKLAESEQRQRSSSRASSPPWRRVAVEGPSSFVENGRRKSSRVNVVPIALQPPGEKRTTRAAQQQSIAEKLQQQNRSGSQQNGRATSSTRATVGKRPLSAGASSANATTPTKNLSTYAEAKRNSANSNSPVRTRSDGQEDRRFKKARLQKAPSPTPPPRRHSGRVARQQQNHASTSTALAGSSSSAAAPTSSPTTYKLRLKIRTPGVPVLHPGGMPPRKKYDTFDDWLRSTQITGPEPEDAWGGDGMATEQWVKREAKTRLNILDASRPGGLLSKERCSVYAPEAQDEPPREFGHFDYVIAHAVNFRGLLHKEQREHRAIAKRLAHAAAVAWKAKQPKTEEEIAREQKAIHLIIHKQLMRDLQQKWTMVATEIHRQRYSQWEEEQQKLANQNLDQILDHSTKLLDHRRLPFNDDSDDAEEDDQLSAEQLREKYAKLLESSKSQRQSVGDAMESEEGEGDDRDEDDEGDPSEDELAEPNETVREAKSAWDHDSEIGIREHGQELPSCQGDKIEYIEDAKRAQPIGVPLIPGVDHMKDIEMDEVDEAMLDDSDESTDMDDDEDTTSDENDGESSEQDLSEEEDEDGNAGTNAGLLGFLSKKEINAAKIHATQDSAEEPAKEMTLNGEDESDDVAPKRNSLDGVHADVSPEEMQEVDILSADATSPASPASSATAKPSEVDSASSVVPSAESKRQSSEPDKEALTKPSSLLRGTLREYQHEGLDWLAKLYADRTNGILADEMGLGKTIQAIALLAHLATEREVWGPHLVVVPTSVMLNWEVEFKKFLPGFKILVYYGTVEERKAKRKGWTDDNLFNVIITSYQLILQDHMAFRIRNWHYMILDEAHNIKNFNSQRWQTLLKFKSQARLLLTGTPLQNNLTELWSLLWFITPGGAGMSTLDEFSRTFKLPAEQIFDKGHAILDSRAKEIVGKLHHMLRPYLLRRLKSEVEKQMPAKYEHVVYCRLSKRQRQLYDGFMSRADTKKTLASGNYMSIINCLMSLRKVCNHPDLFETRQIVTSFAIPRSAVASYEIKELMIRKRLLDQDPLERADLKLFGSEGLSRIDAFRTQFLSAAKVLQNLAGQQSKRLIHSHGDESIMRSTLLHLDAAARKSRLQHLQGWARTTYNRIKNIPMYGTDQVEMLTFGRSYSPNRFAAPRSGRFNAPGRLGISSFRFHGSIAYKAADVAKASRQRVRPGEKGTLTEQYLNSSQVLEDLMPTLDRRAQEMETTIQKYGCITPSAVANDLLPIALTPSGVQTARRLGVIQRPDPFHEARIRLSIAFPDKRLLQYDCGKLQQLDKLLRKLQAEGHRALIFTQMTRVLDILEQFLNIHGHRYLRLDGSTPIELRQALTERFNSDERVLAFILSSRSGGIGINLTGADTVIFYDLDWNPAMDKQCQDRCHRIGQTRDVHIYRFVSEYTIEANILRKSNQKRMLDNVVIQEGEFNTDYFKKLGYRDVLGDDTVAIGEDDEAGAAMDKVLGGGAASVGEVLESAEDKEDVQAAQNARKEEVQTDVADFAESGPGTQTKSTPKSSVPPTPGDAMHPTGADGDDDNELLHVDDYMLRFVDWELSNIPRVPSVGKEHRARTKK